MVTAVRNFLTRLGFWLYVRLHIMQLKSWLHRYAQERRFADYPVQTVDSIDELVTRIQPFIWMADALKQLWDAISFPGRVQWIADYAVKKIIGDCDEFAIYIAAVLKKSLVPGVRNPQLMTVCWADDKGKLGAHNVCLMEFTGAPAEQRYGYMDYGQPRRFSSLRAAAYGVMQRYRGTKCLGWSVSDATSLKPLEVHWR